MLVDLVSVGDHSTACFVSDFTNLPISVHLPLTRLFAGLFVLVPESPEVFATFDRLLAARFHVAGVHSVDGLQFCTKPRSVQHCSLSDCYSSLEL